LHSVKAVEAAAKKGENVTGIAKELELVEKVLTGRGFTRLAKDQVSNFATEVLKGTEILAKRYYRELDGNELIDWAVDGLYITAREKVPAEVIRERSRRPKDFPLTVVSC